LVLATAAHAMVLLGEIDEAEIGRERANDDRRSLERQLLEQGRKLFRSFATPRPRATPPLDGEPPNALLQGEKLASLLLDQDIAEHSAEITDIASERPIDLAPARH
jgi:hypothetical protein